MLKDVSDLDERNYNLYNLLTKNSEWSILKLCSLENFNRSFVGYDSFQMCPLHKDLLDLTTPHQLTGSFTTSAMNCIDDEGVRGIVKHAL